MRKETVDIVEDLFNQLNTTFVGTECVDNGDGTYTLTTCDTLYLQECRKIKIGSRTYSIESIDHNKSITIKGKSKPSELEFEIYPAYYFHGKAMETNAELSMIDDAKDKMPLVYLTEILTDRFYPRDSAMERETDVRMFFLTHANYDDWKTDGHYTGAILPMRNLVYNFLDILENSKIIGKFAQYDLTNHAKFGIFILRKGAEKRIFNDNYSGVELRLRLPILKDLSCTGECE